MKEATHNRVSFEPALIEADTFMVLDLPVKKKILNPWLTTEMIALISGWRGTGKTWFGLSIFDAISRNQSFGPWSTENVVSSLYIDGEMNSGDIQERLMILERGNSSKRRESLTIYSDAYANTLGLPRANLLSKRWREEVKRFAVDKGVRLVGFDNIASLAAGIDENVKREWDPINQWLLELRFLGISSMLFHHTNKEGGQRGTSAREDNIDISIMLFRPHDYSADEGCQFICRFGKSRISTNELSLLQDYEFSLIQGDGGGVEWSWSNPKKKNKEEILRLLDEGIPQVDIAKMLSVSKPFVSKIRATAIRDGLLSAKGKLTKPGLMAINEESLATEFG